MEELKPCPFCGWDPITYFRSYERYCEYPIIRAYVKCEQCGIELSTTIEYDTNTGITSIDSVLVGIETLAQKWNNRMTDRTKDE